MNKYKQERPTGKCRNCGKSTSLFIHQNCGKKIEKKITFLRPNGKVAEITHEQKAKAKERASTKRYLTGDYPNFWGD